MTEKEIKQTRSFRCSPSLWSMVESTAKEQNRRTSEIITEAITKFVGKYVKEDTNLTDTQIVELIDKIQSLDSEIGEVKKVIKANKKIKRK